MQDKAMKEISGAMTIKLFSSSNLFVIQLKQIHNLCMTNKQILNQVICEAQSFFLDGANVIFYSLHFRRLFIRNNVLWLGEPAALRLFNTTFSGTTRTNAASLGVLPVDWLSRRGKNIVRLPVIRWYYSETSCVYVTFSMSHLVVGHL